MEGSIGANFVVGFNSSVVSAIQDRTLARVFRDALFPRILFRAEADPEMWPANLGTNQTFSRSGTMRPSTRPLEANQDPTPLTYGIEQWEATAAQYGGSIDTHMPTSYVTIASLYLRNMHQLGLHSAQSVNRVVRDRLFNAYLAGNTVVSANVGGGVSVPVVSLSGFTRKQLNGRPAFVSPTNPLPILITTGGVTTAFNVVGFTSTFPNDEIHSGILTLDVAHAGLTARDIVRAVNRSRVIRSGGGESVDAISSGDQFTVANVRAAIAQLRRNNVPTHEDGTIHCHLDPDSMNQIFNDNEFQRLNQSLPDYIHYREMALGTFGGVTFYRNTESPVVATVDQDPQFGFTFAGELTNASGVEIHRPIFTGGGAIEEKYLDESKYISEAGINGKIGEFAVVNNGIQVMAERIRLILRAPQDRLQQQTSASWSHSGDWPVPTDSLNTTSPADYKRAVVVEHGI
jgi:hypothetical protein